MLNGCTRVSPKWIANTSGMKLQCPYFFIEKPVIRLSF